MKAEQENSFEKVDLRLLAKQLRKPEGEFGQQLGNAMNVGNAAMNLHTLAALAADVNDTILEIGMGNGYFVKRILSQDPSIRYRGCDYSSDMVNDAKALNQEAVLSGRAEFVQADLTSMPFKTHSFTKVFTVNTIYFWEDIASSLKEIRRVLKPDGLFIVAFRPEENMRKFPVTEHGFNFFSKEKVEQLLLGNGFRDLATTHIYEPEEETFGTPLVKECVLVKGFRSKEE